MTDTDGFGNGLNGFGNNDGSDRVEGLALPPWERRDRFGFLNGLYLTIKDVLLAPGRLFRAMPSEVGLVQPLLFAVVIGVASAFFAWMWSLAGSSFQMLVSDNLATVFREPLLKFLLFLFSPVIVAVLLFVETALVHLVLMVLGGNRLGFEATFRVMAYTEATSILLLVPFCGSGIAVIWGLVAAIIGLYSIHDTDPWRAVIAVLLPSLICLGTFGSFVVLFLINAN